MSCLVTKIEKWQVGDWYFRAKQCSAFEWHVWCSSSELVAEDALREPWTSRVYFRFDRDKEKAIQELKWEARIWKKL
jgi:hypothetical protein